MIIVTDPNCTAYQAVGHPERRQRISRTVEKLESQKELPIQWAKPAEVTDEMILRAHTPELLQMLSTETLGFDADTPAYPEIALHARQSAGAALATLDAAQKGQKAFSLMRPPGHHAERDRAMGFCYLNQMAITALEGLQRGFKKVAVYDFDVHHGNGTENILLNNPQCSFYSIHQYPCYPGTGGETIANCHNYPVRPNTPRKDYCVVLAKALEDLQEWKPDLVGVSAGFDAFRGDPLSEETLEAEDFYWLGCSLRNLKIPMYCCLEGGYSNELPELIFAFLKGLEGV